MIMDWSEYNEMHHICNTCGKDITLTCKCTTIRVERFKNKYNETIKRTVTVIENIPKIKDIKPAISKSRPGSFIIRYFGYINK